MSLDLETTNDVWEKLAQQLPTEIYSDQPPLESDLHLRQIILLLQCLELFWQDRTDFYAAGNMTIYFSPEQIRSRDFRGPDLFVTLETDRRPRLSWVTWAEGGRYPNVIVEVLSDSTAEVDRTTKKQLYQDVFRTPEYFWFHPDTLEFAGFVLLANRYQSIQPNAQGWLWSQQLELFLGIYDDRLRYFTPSGELLPSPEEAARAFQQQAESAQQEIELAQQEIERIQQQAESARLETESAQQQAESAQQQAELAQQQAEQERSRADRLAAKLRELQIDPETFDS